ncbi:sporulation-specific chitinase 2 [[Candida] jaroonii]|uniref:Sporulation-specific chitinase 2 n=1 Tax=[Candida] jaroonii TaxID=467808 RepID=A0ACA9Y189_9ASCO|nr:sporulation-specific chitinase 2 [[Candida] jaroonii]
MTLGILGKHWGIGRKRGNGENEGVGELGETKSLSTGVYYSNWSIYQRKHSPNDIDYEAIDQVYYAFLVLDSNTGKLKFSDTWCDLEMPLSGPGGSTLGLVNVFKQLKVKYPKLKVSFSIGGWGANESFKVVARNEHLVTEFARSCGEFLRNYEFDGIDIDWEYPQTTEEGKQFLNMIRLVKQEMNRVKPGSSLSIAAPAGDDNIKHLRIGDMNQYLDRWNLMCYDFTGSWSQKSGYHSNLYGFNGDNSLNTSEVVHKYIKQGASTHKIIVGMPLYGRIFPGTKKIGTPFDTSKIQGEGTIDYKQLPLPGSQEVFDDKAISVYCYDNSQLITYDNSTTIRYKAEFIKNNHLGGGMFWDSAGDSRPSLITEFSRACK